MRTIKDEFGLYSERLFDDMLCRERKRTERSQKPFVMIMIEINRLTKTKDSLRSLIGIFDDCFRESDIKGWYKNRSVIGIICTEAPNTMNEAIKKKVENAIKQTLYPAFRSIPTISSICFPKTETPETPELDRCVYPELKTNNPKKIISEICKRTMDISVASLMLVTCFPVMLIASVLIKLTSPGPVFFRQERIGYRGRRFTLLKFRSMQVDNDNSVHRDFAINFIKAQNTEVCEKSGAYKIVNDRRITPVGRFLRKTSLDELPQLINVLLGDMSLVGPRPPIQYEVDAYDMWHRRRMMEVKPGITGFWQVHGRSTTTFENMVRMDIHYIKNHNLFFDIALLFKTPLSLLKGAY